MYLKKSSKRKTFAPISAKRRKARRVKVFFLLIFFSLFIILLLWGLNKGIQYVFEHKSNWFTWTAQTLVVEAQDDYTSKQIKDFISFKENAIVSADEAKSIQNTLQSKLPQVKEIKVKRGYFSKELIIKAENHEILATLIAKEKLYLVSQTGVLFNYEHAQIPSDILQIKTEKEIKGSFLPQEFVKLLKDISKNPLPDLDFIEVNLEKETYSLNFKDGSVVAMGLFDLYNDKIVVLKDIIDISQKKGIEKPYKINFNYFKHGKIYLNSQV
ncbi:MAG: hypothetical protein IKP23_00460 [Elusimicrobiaceae bacterium]|nr:hypothetical protein [Elusimicrobiaceae bacterium]